MSNECSYNELYPLQVLDDSMEPEFPAKCVIVIEPAEVCATGAYILAEVDGERWFRQYVSEGDEKKRLRALKAGYPAIDLTGKSFKILGVIVQRNVKRDIKHYSPYVPNGGAPQVTSLK